MDENTKILPVEEKKSEEKQKRKKKKIDEEYVNGILLKIENEKKEDEEEIYKIEACNKLYKVVLRYNEDRDRWQGLINDKSLSFFSMKKDALKNCKLRIVLENRTEITTTLDKSGIGD